MSDALVPVEEKVIRFYDDTLVAVQLQDSTIYVPVKRLCDNLGLNWRSQWNRIRRDTVLNESAKGVVVTTTPHGGGRQEMLCLPLKFIPGWLFGVNASRVKEEIREKLLRYQRECYDVLWDAFKVDILPGLQLPAEGLTPAERALALAEAVATMARRKSIRTIGSR